MSDRVSANYVYLDRVLRSHGVTGPVLDLGCGDGGLISYLRARGHDVWGCDLPYRAGALRERFGDEFGSRVRVSVSPDAIPFDTGVFSAVFANQVFEHVQPLPAIVAECRRVLKPGGLLAAPFPLRSTPVETHVFVPFVHWIEPRRREAYLRAWFAVPFTCRGRRGSRTEIASRAAKYLNEETWYRSRGQIEALLEQHFAHVSVDTAAYVRTKLDLLAADPRPRARALGRALRMLPSSALGWGVTYAVNACFVATARA